MIESYGVYCRRSISEDEGGFIQPETKSNYHPEHRIMVNSSRNGTTTNTIVDCSLSKEDDRFNFCCFNDSKMQTERNSHWYRSSIVLLLLIISLAVILMVSGLLFYFKYFNRKYKIFDSLENKIFF